MVNQQEPIISRDYEAELEELKKIYAGNKMVQQSVIDFNNQNSVVNINVVNTIVIDNTGGSHAK